MYDFTPPPPVEMDRRRPSPTRRGICYTACTNTALWGKSVPDRYFGSPLYSCPHLRPSDVLQGTALSAGRCRARAACTKALNLNLVCWLLRRSMHLYRIPMVSVVYLNLSGSCRLMTEVLKFKFSTSIHLQVAWAVCIPVSILIYSSSSSSYLTEGIPEGTDNNYGRKFKFSEW